MNRKAVLVLLMFCLMVLSCGGGGGGSESNPDSRKDICVAMGDSITVGDGATSYANSYVSLLSTWWAKTIINEGVGGAYSSYGAATIDEFLYQYNPRYLTIYFGTNDAGLMDPDRTISNLQYMIERAKDNGTIPVVATLGPCFDEWAWREPYMIDLSRRIRQLAASEGIACADIEPALGWNKSYMADSLHPNDAGHRIIADTFYKALTQ
jgi:acyl-CoA thioesterase-1